MLRSAAGAVRCGPLGERHENRRQVAEAILIAAREGKFTIDALTQTGEYALGPSAEAREIILAHWSQKIAALSQHRHPKALFRESLFKIFRFKFGEFGFEQALVALNVLLGAHASALFVHDATHDTTLAKKVC